MPIYEYSCRDCGQDQENLVKSTEDKPVCETCGSRTMKRKLSIFAVSTASSLQECACAAGGGCTDSDMVGCCGHQGD